MATLLDDEIVTPSIEDTDIANESIRRLAKIDFVGRKTPLELHLHNTGQQDETITIPASAFKLLQIILIQMAKGNAVTLIPINAELTTQQAADLLNVSRPFLIDLLEKGDIPFHKVGTHRRVLFKDLMEFKQKNHEARQKALDELSILTQEMGLDN